MGQDMKGPAKKTSVADRILLRLQGFAEALEGGEDIAERFTCRRVTLDLKATAYDAEKVRQTRQLLHASQALFAQFLGVSVRTVRSWEQGVNTPSDLARRFLDEIRHDPPYWRARLRGAVIAR